MIKILRKIVSIYVAFTIAVTPVLVGANFIKAIGYLTSTSFFALTVDAFADEIDDKALEGQKAGNSYIRGFSLPTVDQNTGQTTITKGFDTPIVLQRDDLHQGASTAGSNPANAYGSNTEMINKTNEISQSYANPNNQSMPANAYRTLVDGEINTHARLGQNDPIATRARDIFSDKNGDISSILSNCTNTTTTTGFTTGSTTPTPDIQACQVLDGQTQNCQLIHDLQLEVNPNIGFSLSVNDNNNSGTTNTFGNCTLNFLTGESQCQVNNPRRHSLSMAVVNTLPPDICNPNTDQSEYFQLRTTSFPENDPDGNPIDITQQSVYLTLFVTQGKHNKGYLNTNQFPTCENGMVGQYSFDLSCTEDPCTGKKDFAFTYTTAKILKDEWAISDTCRQSIQAIQDSTYCTGNITCNSADPDGCVTIGGIRNCPGGILEQRLSQPPVELQPYGISPLCTAPVLEKTCNTCLDPNLCDPSKTDENNCSQLNSECRQIRADCLDNNFNNRNCYAFENTYDCNITGSHAPDYKYCSKVETPNTVPPTNYCYKDSNNIFRCDVLNSTQVSNSCAAYETDKRCKLVFDECPIGLEDPITGSCTVHTKTYDCGFSSDGTSVTPTVTTTATCEGSAIRCVGSDCLVIPSEVNNDFGEVLANASIVNYAQQDANCGIAGDCTFFGGKKYTCKTGFFGVVDCCVKPSGGQSIGEYIRLGTQVWSAAQNTELGEMFSAQAGKLTGSISTFLEPATGAASDLFYPLTSAYDQLGSTVTSAFIEPGTAWANIGTTFSNDIANFVGSTFGEAARDAIFDQVYSGSIPTGDFALNVTNLTNAFQPLMTAYMYYQIAVLIIQIIYACEDQEFELGAKKQLKVCHYNGKYCDQKVAGICVLKKESHCCFNSAFSRIMQEQIRPQLDKTWGSAKNPNCEGISMAELASVDFSQVDLSEWISLLNVAGIQPESSAEYQEDWAIDNITKPSGGINQKDVFDRLQENVGNPAVDLSTTAEEVKSKIW